MIGQELGDALIDAGPGLAAVLLAIAGASLDLADRLAQGALAGDPDRVVGTNTTGDAQKMLDLWAHELMLEALRGASVRHVLSEEADEIATLDPDGVFDVALDPIDGSGSLGLGLPLGTLAAIWPASPDGFRRPGREAVASLYVSYGHSTDLGLTIGKGTAIATLDRASNVFRITHPGATIPPTASTLAYNASNERHWAPGLRHWAEDLRLGRDGPRGRDFNMRWLAAAVGDLHRILLKGGAFLYPADGRPGYAEGKLRLLYEAVPIALLIENAGGFATDGINPILDIVPTSPHAHVPLIFGAREEVSLIRTYLQP